MELAFLEWLERRVATHPLVTVGPGDDAAVLAPAGSRSTVVTTDALTDQVDFRLGVDPPARIGRKALAVNLSDLAAMAAEPVAAFVSLVLPRADAGPLARELTLGMLDLAREFDLAIAGGDTNCWDGGLVINVTAVGRTTAKGPVLRSGGRPGDVVLATGRFGGSLLGRQFDFTPRIREALAIHARWDVRAAIDVSDGLSLDLHRLAAASRCGAELDRNAIPVAPAAYLRSLSPDDRLSPLEHALGDGEDFELLLAMPEADAARLLDEQPFACGVARIGRLVPEPGLWLVDSLGRRSPLVPRGFEHLGRTTERTTETGE